MAIIKCKMCGGELALIEGSTVAECEYCGTKQTVPIVDNEKKITMYSRANRLRANCEFDKASGVYESLVAEFPEDAEVYWGLVLCKYGIEYVDDTLTGRKVPTCHRSNFESVFDDSNYELVLEYADSVAKKIYREEAKVIEELRKGIIEVSSKEKPYDIFICYKETSEDGTRTLDSVIAQDIYDALTEKKYRVFFSRITLEDKLGQAYEPYIFAALNSAKVMLVVGTDYEHFDAVWVKNEWSRYLRLVSTDSEKHLIPCYKGIDAYDMPKEFAKLQAQDMGKIGAMQDLLRGIDKLIAPTEKEIIISGEVNVINSTLKRAYEFLNVQDWESAKKCLDTVLGHEPQNVSALIGCLMHKLQIPQEQKLEDVSVILEKEEYYKQAIRFANDDTSIRLSEYNRSSIYNYAMMQSKLPGGASIALAIQSLESISGWKDVDEKLLVLKQKQKDKRKQRKRIISLVSAVVVLVICGLFLVNFNKSYLVPLNVYKKAVNQMEQGSYPEAIEIFSTVPEFQDSQNQIKQCRYLYAQDLMNQENYKEAENLLYQVGDYKDAIERYGECKYQYAMNLLEKGESEEAEKAFKDLTDWLDNETIADELVYLNAQRLAEVDQLKMARRLFGKLGIYKDSKEWVKQMDDEMAYQKGIDMYQIADTKLEFNSAIKILSTIAEYKDAQQYINEAKYKIGIIEYENESYESAISIFYALGNAGHIESEKRLHEIEDEIYLKGKSEYDATNWGTAKKWLDKLAETNYNDSILLAEKCEEQIAIEREVYIGEWRNADKDNDDLKIGKGGASRGDIDSGEWKKVDSFSYNEDTGVLRIMCRGSSYIAKVSGNKLTLIPQNEGSFYFGFNNVFYRK